MENQNTPSPSSQNPQGSFSYQEQPAQAPNYAQPHFEQNRVQVAPNQPQNSSSTAKVLGLGCLGCLGLIGIAFFVLIGIAMLTSDGSSSQSTNSEPTNTISSTTQPADQKPAEPANTSEPKKEAGKPVPSKAPEPEVVKISAIKLNEAYQKNEIAADKLYRGKQLEVTGKVTDISEVLGVKSLQLRGQDTEYSFENIYCSVKDDQLDKLASLEKGQEVTITGIGDGMGIALVEIKNCRIK